MDGRRTPLVGGLIGWAVPEVMRNVDTNALLESIDVQAIVDQLDVDAIAARLDLDALIQRMDVEAIAGRLDLDALVGRLDVDAIAGRLDLDALIGRLDVDAIAARMDLDALVHQIDISRVMGRGTQEFAGSSLDLVRRQLVRVDSGVNRLTDRVLRHDRSTYPAGPASLISEPVSEPATSELAAEGPRRRDVSGHYAGPISRVVALLLDSFAAVTIFGLLGAVGNYLLNNVIGVEHVLGGGSWLSRALLGSWMLLWFWVSVALVGRTPAMLLVGLRVVGRDGTPIPAGRALVRALVEPIATVIFVIGWLGVFVGRERRAFQDVASGAVVIYDWGARPAEEPTAVIEQLGQMIRSNRAAARRSSAPDGR